ncbi:hypothetical protein EJB05_34595, partial [Eragrostis curvula]
MNGRLDVRARRWRRRTRAMTPGPPPSAPGPPLVPIAALVHREVGSTNSLSSSRLWLRARHRRWSDPPPLQRRFWGTTMRGWPGQLDWAHIRPMTRFETLEAASAEAAGRRAVHAGEAVKAPASEVNWDSSTRPGTQPASTPPLNQLPPILVSSRLRQRAVPNLRPQDDPRRGRRYSGFSTINPQRFGQKLQTLKTFSFSQNQQRNVRLQEVLKTSKEKWRIAGGRKPIGADASPWNSWTVAGNHEAGWWCVVRWLVPSAVLRPPGVRIPGAAPGIEVIRACANAPPWISLTASVFCCCGLFWVHGWRRVRFGGIIRCVSMYTTVFCVGRWGRFDLLEFWRCDGAYPYGMELLIQSCRCGRLDLLMSRKRPCPSVVHSSEEPLDCSSRDH